MSKKQLTVRIQSAEGTKRIDLLPQDTFAKLYQKTTEIFTLQSNDGYTLYKEKNKQSPLPRSTSKSIQNAIQHGDMLYLVVERDDILPTITTNYASSPRGIGIKNDPTTTSGPSSSSYSRSYGSNFTNGNSYVAGSVPYGSTHSDYQLSKIDLKEDEVDEQLDKMDGKIERKRDPQLCHHNVHGKCIHCIPIEPYDEEYLQNRNPPIKHMSFRAYIRKLQSASRGDRNTFASLENISCSIKERCKTGHAPWPKGICTKCQPNSLTLNRQPYRHVDNIMFENGNLVNRFLNYWRLSGHQRIGFLYGRYEVYEGVPLGIRAVVAAIYEPPQETSRDGVKLTFPDPHEALIDDLSRRLNIRRIGWIFTDLLPDETKPGSVLHHRGNIDSYFLSAQECIMAGWFQNNYPNVCKYSPDGFFGSKFVTVVVTGDSTGQIHFEGYQVSNQCMALVKSKCLVPTYDSPELGYVKETSSEQYVPDVFYKEKDSYNNEIMKIGRPLPLEYLIIDVPTGFPSDINSRSTFNDSSQLVKTPFSVENRMQIGELQDMNTLANYLNQFQTIGGGSRATTMSTSKSQAFDIMADIHFLLYLAINDIIPFSTNHLDPLLDAIRANDTSGIETWMEGGDWQTIVQVIHSQSPSTLTPMTNDARMDYDTFDQQQSSAQWSCERCTFLNSESSTKCEICSFDKPR